MSDTQMLQNLIDGQLAIQKELKHLGTEVDNFDSKLHVLEDNLSTKIDRVEQNITRRINTLGQGVANIEDDAPTIEEFDNLEKRVKKLEQKTFASA